MKDNKFTILLPYYNRPNMVRYALESLKNQNYSNWELFFCDDGSEYSGEKVLDEYFKDDSRVFYENTNTSPEEKEKHKSFFGKYLNEFILKSNSDICLVLCDDDALYENYLSNLNAWYNKNSEYQYSYCHIVPFNPFLIKSLRDVSPNQKWHLNRTGSINPSDKIDSSQVSWRTEIFKTHNIKFPYPQTASLDSVLFQHLYETFGPCPFNEIVGQYKGVHKQQLGQRFDYNTKDISYIPS